MSLCIWVMRCYFGSPFSTIPHHYHPSTTGRRIGSQTRTLSPEIVSSQNRRWVRNADCSQSETSRYKQTNYYTQTAAMAWLGQVPKPRGPLGIDQSASRHKSGFSLSSLFRHTFAHIHIHVFVNGDNDDIRNSFMELIAPSLKPTTKANFCFMQSRIYVKNNVVHKVVLWSEPNRVETVNQEK